MGLLGRACCEALDVGSEREALKSRLRMELAVDVLPRVLMEDSAALCSDNASNYSERCSLAPEEVGGVTVDVALGCRATS